MFKNLDKKDKDALILTAIYFNSLPLISLFFLLLQNKSTQSLLNNTVYTVMALLLWLLFFITYLFISILVIKEIIIKETD